MSRTALHVQHLHYTLGQRPLLRDINVAFQSGQLHVLLGPNGAGKSTLLKQLMSEQHQQGDVLFWSASRATWPRDTFARQVAFLPQTSELTFAFTVKDVVEMGGTPLKANRKQIRALAEEQLHQWHVSHLAHRAYPTLSGGEKQRVHMARISMQLAHTEPTRAMMMLDEPTSALDISHQHQTLMQCRALVDQGMTVIIVLHDLNLASRYADYLYFMKQGEMVLSGTPWQCFTHHQMTEIYQHPLTVMTHPTHACPLIVT
ncbi:heme ABC transporter ATP-binding protein [Salinivibrio sp. IB868]|uniref:heme ABC transporter ATP-binding protein n=1 Tax=unclassified Salinivibrio TaxID=2636825 RepID=UPI0009866BC8|nr:MULTISPECIES: heme ABC transporter ATP-binding protein [unclassified Salinivibrio]OOE69586.1 heme ABC transporter ATP-binding protein [Salinivibrio sp. IB868]OOE73581.1 heme ABC transporter ATP-binding protein [Salinivibrio sp. IB870]